MTRNTVGIVFMVGTAMLAAVAIDSTRRRRRRRPGALGGLGPRFDIRETGYSDYGIRITGSGVERDENFPAEERHVDPAWLAETKHQVRHLHETLVPALGLFPGFDVYPADLREHGVLARYVGETSDWPMIVMDLKVTAETADKHGVEPEDAVESTITHELGHAVQESLGLPKTEKQAEAFAHHWWTKRQVLPAFAKKLARRRSRA